MPGLHAHIDPDGLLEYSVVYTDRGLNHMSMKFQGAMRDISAMLKEVYAAHAVAVVPGSGTYGMEAVARQYATGRKCLVLRNGWFSYRWTQIFERGHIPSESIVLKARPVEAGRQPHFAPAPINEVVATIQQHRPAVVFAPHVETSAGMILPSHYIQAVADAVHAVDGIFVLDGIASGAMWVDMQACGVDVLLSAPQKGWTGEPCAGLVMMGPRGVERALETTSTSFACDLGKWLEIMQAYEKGGHAYHATMPTNALVTFRDAMQATQSFGFDNALAAQEELGRRVRQLLADKSFKSIAAPDFRAPGVVVCYTDKSEIQNGSCFAAEGIQIAAGVPLQCDEQDDFQTFRIGLFGLDKLQNIERTIATLDAALTRIVA